MKAILISGETRSIEAIDIDEEINFAVAEAVFHQLQKQKAG